MKNTIKLFLATASVALFTACGGGGGGGTPAPVASTSTFPLFTIHVNTLQASSNSFSYSGMIDGTAITGSGNVTRGGLSSGTFESIAAQQRTTITTGSISGNGQTLPMNTSGVGWYDSNYLPLGSNGGEEYVVVNRPAVIPATVRVNDAGMLYTSNRYTTSSKTSLLGTESVSYVIEADTATTALLTFIVIEKNNSNSVTSTVTRQMRITPTGTFTRTKDTLLSGTSTLTVTYN
jgi:hypothetical protein